jgi:steroid 5-alpha reductase family enzyme
MKSLFFIAVISLSLTWAASQGGQSYLGVPIFSACAALIFLMQWLAFIPAYIRQTEVFYDLTGSITYITVVLLAFLMSGSSDLSSMIIAGCILVWAFRLGSFLFKRILEDGSDGRFDKIKISPQRFFVTWNLQALWVLVTAGCGLAALTSAGNKPQSELWVFGFLVWIAGFAIELVADNQKRAFRKQYGPERFVNTGLWSRSRHPNYFGEIVLWVGIALMALPVLSGWQYLTLISPFFVYILLTRISGIPLLERKADHRWLDNPGYQAYKRETPVLVPRLLKR